MNLKFVEENDQTFDWRINQAFQYRTNAKKIYKARHQMEQLVYNTPYLPWHSMSRILKHMSGKSASSITLKNPYNQVYNIDPTVYIKN